VNIKKTKTFAKAGIDLMRAVTKVFMPKGSLNIDCLLLIVLIVFKGLKTLTTLRDFRLSVPNAISTNLKKKNMSRRAKTYPATTTVPSIRFQPFLIYEFSLRTRPFAKILIAASAMKMIVNLKLI
jgi:hypothetical protein